MAHLLIHIGMPKTATTTLQRMVFACHSKVRYLGKPFDPGVAKSVHREGRLPKDAMRALWTDEPARFDVETLRRRFAEFLVATQDDRVLVISEEGLATGAFVDRGVVAQRLRDIVGQARILMTVRSQFSCLPSLYHHYLRKGWVTIRPFERWLETVIVDNNGAPHPQSWMVDQYRHSVLVNRYSEVFGANAVAVMTYEQLTRNHVAFARDLDEFSGIDQTETHRLLEEGKHLNTGLTYDGAVADRRIRSAHRLYGKWRQRLLPGFSIRTQLPALWKLKENLVTRVVRGSASAARLDNPAGMSLEARARIAEYFAADNRALMEATGLPLDDYGYPL
ncbi:MAG: hypothetical protein ACTSX7_12625 [Alphaproteobacteria bacterium]